MKKAAAAKRAKLKADLKAKKEAALARKTQVAFGATTEATEKAKAIDDEAAAAAATKAKTKEDAMARVRAKMAASKEQRNKLHQSTASVASREDVIGGGSGVAGGGNSRPSAVGFSAAAAGLREAVAARKNAQTRANRITYDDTQADAWADGGGGSGAAPPASPPGGGGFTPAASPRSQPSLGAAVGGSPTEGKLGAGEGGGLGRASPDKGSAHSFSSPQDVRAPGGGFTPAVSPRSRPSLGGVFGGIPAEGTLGGGEGGLEGSGGPEGGSPGGGDGGASAPSSPPSAGIAKKPSNSLRSKDVGSPGAGTQL